MVTITKQLTPAIQVLVIKRFYQLFFESLDRKNWVNNMCCWFLNLVNLKPNKSIQDKKTTKLDRRGSPDQDSNCCVQSLGIQLCHSGKLLDILKLFMKNRNLQRGRKPSDYRI